MSRPKIVNRTVLAERFVSRMAFKPRRSRTIFLTVVKLKKRGEINFFIQRQRQEGQMALQGAIGHPLSETGVKKNS